MKTGAESRDKAVVTKTRHADADWYDRIRRAKNAREQGQKARENDPAVRKDPRLLR